jgi:hypothetical protein
VVHGATRQQLAACSSGALATATGKWLSHGVFSDPTGNTAQLNGVKVKINDAYVPVLSVAPLAVDFVYPILPAGTPLDISV